MAMTPMDARAVVRRKTRRQVVWEMTGGRCFYCGVDLRETGMTIDHVQPRALGGATKLNNIVPCCEPCNRAKGSLTLEEYRLAAGVGRFHGEER